MARGAGNKAELLSNGIILITKVGDQNGRTIAHLYKKIGKIAKELRAQNKTVLLLSDNTREGEMTLTGWKAGDALGHTVDFDKSATFGTPPITRAKRQYIINVQGNEQRIADFDTREEAEAWLLGNPIGPGFGGKNHAEAAGKNGVMKPKFLPKTWAIFKLGDGHTMGEIVSADVSGTTGWVYHITQPIGKNTYKVPEADITHILKDTEWVLVEPGESDDYIE